MGAAAVDEVNDARPAERAERRVHREAPGPARGLRGPVQPLPTARPPPAPRAHPGPRAARGRGVPGPPRPTAVLRPDRVACLGAHGGPMGIGMGAEDEARVVGYV